MEIHQLRYFCAVADTGSFSRAAEQSHVSQPSLSQQILKLEDELGARLFDRLGRSVRLTEVGKAFLPRARGVLRELEAARGDVVEQKGSVGGSVTVGAIPTVAPYLLPRVLTDFSRKFPQAQLSVIEEITPVLLDRLRAAPLTSPSSPSLSAATNSNPSPSSPNPSSPSFRQNTNWHAVAPYPLKTSARNPSSCFAMGIVSAKTPSLPAIVPASTHKSFSKADSFPVCWVW